MNAIHSIQPSEHGQVLSAALIPAGEAMAFREVGLAEYEGDCLDRLSCFHPESSYQRLGDKCDLRKMSQVDIKG